MTTLRPAKTTHRAAAARQRSREQDVPSSGNETAAQPVPPPWGWKLPYAGRAAHVAAAPEHQATTAQACALFPFVAGSGTPVTGTPLGAALRRIGGASAQRLRWEVRSRRLSLLLALATLVRGGPVSNAEEVVLGRAIALLDGRLRGQRAPTVPDVLDTIEQGPDTLRSAARATSRDSYGERVADLVFTLDLLCTGSLAGVFDVPTTSPLDPTPPAVSVDISRVGAAGDKLLTAAMLCTWAYGFAMADAAAALAELGIAPRRTYLGVMDELWRPRAARPPPSPRAPTPARPP